MCDVVSEQKALWSRLCCGHTDIFLKTWFWQGDLGKSDLELHNHGFEKRSEKYMKLFEREGVNNNWVLSDSMGIFVQVRFWEGFGDYWEARVDLGSAMPGSCETAESIPGWTG